LRRNRDRVTRPTYTVMSMLLPFAHSWPVRCAKCGHTGIVTDRTGAFVASVSTLWTFIVAVFLWWFAVLPLIFVVAFTYGAVR
jgi:hypothetical protein